MIVNDQHFEDRLLSELQQVVRANPAPQLQAAQAAPRRRRTRLSIAGAAGVATATAVGFAVFGGGGTAAFAVDRQADGSVTVTINSLRDADGLQKALIAKGVPAVVNYTPAGKACQQPRFTPARTGGPGTNTLTTTRPGSTTFTLSNNQLKAGQTLVIETSVGRGLSALNVGVAQGRVAPCVLVDAPRVPDQGTGAQGGSGPGLHTVTSTHGSGDDAGLQQGNG